MGIIEVGGKIEIFMRTFKPALMTFLYWSFFSWITLYFWPKKMQIEKIWMVSWQRSVEDRVVAYKHPCLLINPRDKVGIITEEEVGEQNRLAKAEANR
jgi:hypothetical protein